MGKSINDEVIAVINEKAVVTGSNSKRIGNSLKSVKHCIKYGILSVRKST